jgi:formylglycine-generating enzyme required for sulfatase activity
MLPGTRATWALTIQPTVRGYSARLGEPIRYARRSTEAIQDWRRLPVSGISAEDAEAYVRWLDRSGRVPLARLCSEHEWERAARGADEREYPHGNRLHPSDAAYDETYGKEPLAFGPDEVGSHPASQSPFGVDDLAGNVWEWTRASIGNATFAGRGGSFYDAAVTNRSSNRNVPEPTYRGLPYGLRVCASVPPEEPVSIRPPRPG